MQASRLTRIATWLASGPGTVSAGRTGNRLAATPCRSAISQNRLERSCAASRAGWSPSSNSMTIARAFVARSPAVVTTIPAAGLRTQEAASTRSPAISTMQARQLPSAR